MSPSVAPEWVNATWHPGTAAGSPSPGMGLRPSRHDAAWRETSPWSRADASARSSLTYASSIEQEPSSCSTRCSSYQEWSIANVEPGWGRAAGDDDGVAAPGRAVGGAYAACPAVLHRHRAAARAGDEPSPAPDQLVRELLDQVRQGDPALARVVDREPPRGPARTPATRPPTAARSRRWHS
ncbi:hypothetical protein [Nonomuraea sp. NPDC003201]